MQQNNRTGFMINMLKNSEEILAPETSQQRSFGAYSREAGRNYRYHAHSHDGTPLNEFYTMIDSKRFHFQRGLNGGVWQKKEARDAYIKWLNASCGEIVCEAAEAT